MHVAGSWGFEMSPEEFYDKGDLGVSGVGDVSARSNNALVVGGVFRRQYLGGCLRGTQVIAIDLGGLCKVAVGKSMVLEQPVDALPFAEVDPGGTDLYADVGVLLDGVLACDLPGIFERLTVGGEIGG